MKLFIKWFSYIFSTWSLHKHLIGWFPKYILFNIRNGFYDIPFGARWIDFKASSRKQVSSKLELLFDFGSRQLVLLWLRSCWCSCGFWQLQIIPTFKVYFFTLGNGYRLRRWFCWCVGNIYMLVDMEKVICLKALLIDRYAPNYRIDIKPCPRIYSSVNRIAPEKKERKNIEPNDHRFQSH